MSIVARTIEGVVFDLGGVLIDWDPRYLYRKLFDDEEAMEVFLREVCNGAWNEKQDAGRRLSEATETLIAEHPDKADLIRAYYDRWPEMLAGSLPQTVAVLAELKEASIPLFSLTNWSAETFPVALERFDFLQWFENIVVSGAEGVIKPDRRCFDILIERTGLPAAGLVFVDDRTDNVVEARNAGFQALQFTTADQLRQDLRALGLPFVGAASYHGSTG